MITDAAVTTGAAVTGYPRITVGALGAGTCTGRATRARAAARTTIATALAIATRTSRAVRPRATSTAVAADATAAVGTPKFGRTAIAAGTTVTAGKTVRTARRADVPVPAVATGTAVAGPAYNARRALAAQDAAGRTACTCGSAGSAVATGPAVTTDGGGADPRISFAARTAGRTITAGPTGATGTTEQRLVSPTGATTSAIAAIAAGATRYLGCRARRSRRTGAAVTTKTAGPAMAIGREKLNVRAAGAPIAAGAALKPVAAQATRAAIAATDPPVGPAGPTVAAPAVH